MISVIVPVYNTEKYLDRCIQSILSQTYSNIEILLIDDGSTDSSGVICDRYAEQDSRVRVFHKENGGVSSARNMGLDNAKGEWITFVDSDDYINDNFLQVVIENVSSKIDLIVTNVIGQKEMFPEEYVREILMRRIPPQIWGKLFRKSVLKKSLCLPRNLYWGEDLITNVSIGLNLRKKILLKNICCYNYNINESSISTQRESSLEYEEYFLEVLKSKLGNDLMKYNDAFNFTALYIIEDLIVCRQTVDYESAWIKDLKKWGKTQSLTIRQKIVLYTKNNVLCRYLLSLHRKITHLSATKKV